METSFKLIECPRDALQGFPKWVATPQKIEYYQQLLKVGFDTLDCGSFVSPKAVPQMIDTAQVIAGLDCSQTKTKLLVIVANLRGAQEAVKYEKISYLGYPFSISENFQMRNTGKTIEESVPLLKEIIRLSDAVQKEVVVYLSMGFGNPYGDPWSPQIIKEKVAQLATMGIKIFSLSDTVGSARPEDVQMLFSHLSETYPNLEFGAHFHTHPKTWFEKVNAAFLGGCKRFDGTIKGRGGCPMAQNHLVGNMPTEKLISFFTTRKCLPNIDLLAFESAFNTSHSIFI